MRANIDLEGFIGAQEVTLGGQPGVFIPFVPNCNRILYKRRKLAIASVVFFPSSSKKSFDMKGKLSIPKDFLDRCISDPNLIRRNDTIAWLWSGEERAESLVSNQEFESIIGLDER